MVCGKFFYFLLCFPSADTIWERGFDSLGQSKILYSTNGGLNRVTNYIDPVGQAIESIFFINARTVWAAGLAGKIIHTTDAGDSWIF